MSKKEKLNNIPKDKYIYQRYKGIITKYIQKEGYYIDCATGISTKIEEHLLLGKISKKLNRFNRMWRYSKQAFDY